MDKNNKNSRIYFRVTEKEKKIIMDKAKNYPSVSSFILDACRLYDDELGIKKLERLKSWSSDYKSFESEINHVGNNLNQLSKYLNRLSSVGVQSEDVLESCFATLKNIEKLMLEIIESNIKYKNVASKLLKDNRYIGK